MSKKVNKYTCKNCGFSCYVHNDKAKPEFCGKCKSNNLIQEF